MNCFYKTILVFFALSLIGCTKNDGRDDARMESGFIIQGSQELVNWWLASAVLELEGDRKVVFDPVTRSMRVGEKLFVSFQSFAVRLDSGELAYGWSLYADRGPNQKDKVATTRALAEILFRRHGVRIAEFRYKEPDKDGGIRRVVLTRGVPTTHLFLGDISDLENYFPGSSLRK